MSGAKHGEVLVAWPGSSAPVHQPASLVGAGHPVFSIHRRDIIHGQPITGDKPFTNTSDLLGNACIVEPLLDHFFNDDASHQKLIEFLKGCAERAHEAGAVVLLIYRKANRHGRMPLVGASGSQAPIQIYFVNWGMKALQFSRERKYAKLTIYDGGWAEDAASTSGPKTYSAVAASSGASALAAAPAALPPVVETGGWAEWVNRGVQGVNRGVQAVKTAIVGLDFDLAKKLEPLVNISTSWTADPNVFANVTKLLGEFDRHVQATLASTTYLPHLSSELINVADLLEKYRTDSFLSDPCFTLLVCELYWNYCAAAKGFQVYVSEPAKARIRVLVRRSIDAYTICENPSELDIFRSEKFEAIVIYRSNPTQELSWMCKHIISCGILDMSGKSLLTMVWIHACCRRQAPELLKDHNFLRTWSDKMLQSDRDYTLDFGLVNAFTEAFGSAPQAHQLFFSIVANANEFLRVWGIMSCAGPVFVEDELLRRVMEGLSLLC